MILLTLHIMNLDTTISKDPIIHIYAITTLHAWYGDLMCFESCTCLPLAHLATVCLHATAISSQVPVAPISPSARIPIRHIPQPINNYARSQSRRSFSKMSLTATYKQYLNSPSESFFASDASLNYVTTTTSLSQPASIIKHVKTQQQMVEKKAENFLNVIENSNSLCIETETTVKFVAGGGVYLPNIDDNFLCDRIVTLPIVSGPGKISVSMASDTTCRFTSSSSTTNRRSNRFDSRGIKAPYLKR